MSDQFSVLFVNNDGGGFAKHVSVLEGTRLTAFLTERGCDTTGGRLLVRVNNDIAPDDYILRAEDKIVASPTKLVGA